MEKVVGSALEVSTKRLFAFRQVLIKIWVENSVLLFNEIWNRKSVFGMLSPLTKLILLHTDVFLCYANQTKIASLVKGGKAVKMLKK